MNFPEPTRNTGTTDHKRPLIGPVIAGGTPAPAHPVTATHPIPPLFIRTQRAEAVEPTPVPSATIQAPESTGVGRLDPVSSAEAPAGSAHWFDDSWETVEPAAAEARTDADVPEIAAEGLVANPLGTETDAEPDVWTSEEGGFHWAVPDWRPREREDEAAEEPSTVFQTADASPAPSGFMADAEAERLDVFGSDTVDSADARAGAEMEPSASPVDDAVWPESHVPAGDWSGGSEPPITPDSGFEPQLAERTVELPAEPHTAGAFDVDDIGETDPLGGGVAEELPGEAAERETLEVAPELVQAPAPEAALGDVSHPAAEPEAAEDGWGDEWFTAAISEADVALEPAAVDEQPKPASGRTRASEEGSGVTPVDGGLDLRAVELAERLERIAGSLRAHGAAGPLMGAGGDPLANLIAGYLLGMSESREPRGDS